MHVLVTGANGLVGRELCRRLQRAGALHGRRIARLSALDLGFGDQPAVEGALQRHAGDDLVRYVPDARIEGLFGRFGRLQAEAAQQAGFATDADLATLVRRLVEAG